MWQEVHCCMVERKVGYIYIFGQLCRFSGSTSFFTSLFKTLWHELRKFLGCMLNHIFHLAKNKWTSPPRDVIWALRLLASGHIPDLCNLDFWKPCFSKKIKTRKQIKTTLATSILINDNYNLVNLRIDRLGRVVGGN